MSRINNQLNNPYLMSKSSIWEIDKEIKASPQIPSLTRDEKTLRGVIPVSLQ
jgi:hypothetical protein